MPIDPPFIENLAALIEKQIADGELRPGDKLPSLPQLVAEHRISLGSVRAAMLILKLKGTIRSHPGKGFYVPD